MKLQDIPNIFPPPETGEGPEGIIGLTEDITPDMLLSAYLHGIFPWPYEEKSVLWCSPDPRGILDFSDLHIGRSVRRMLNKGEFSFKFNTRFQDVMRACASVKRQGEQGTWITEKLINTYSLANKYGFAVSFEAYDEKGELAGGMYGIRLGQRFFAGESMFHYKSGASKFALTAAIALMREEGVQWMDTQMVTPITGSMGAKEIPRAKYLSMLRAAL